MRHLALVVFGGALSACGGFIRVHAVAPEPVVAVEAAPAPPVAEAPAAPAEANVEVAAPEVTTADPEEVTATTEPPELVYEEQTDLPGPGYFWVHGYWGWTGLDWAWYPGQWLVQPEGRLYIEPYYERVGPNVVYVNGYWGVRDAPRRSYGGERIRFAAAVRPADYRRGERPRFERNAGTRPGSRPAGFYERASGPARPLPHATAPSRPMVARNGSGPRTEARGEAEARGGRGPEGAAKEGAGPRPASSGSGQGPRGGQVGNEQASPSKMQEERGAASHDKTASPREGAPRAAPTSRPAPAPRPAPRPAPQQQKK